MQNTGERPNNIIISQSMFDGNTFFIFRDLGIEVKIQINVLNRIIKSSHTLTPIEYDYVCNYLLNGQLSDMNKVEVYNDFKYSEKENIYSYGHKAKD